MNEYEHKVLNSILNTYNHDELRDLYDYAMIKRKMTYDDLYKFALKHGYITKRTKEVRGTFHSGYSIELRIKRRNGREIKTIYIPGTIKNALQEVLFRETQPNHE